MIRRSVLTIITFLSLLLVSVKSVSAQGVMSLDKISGLIHKINYYSKYDLNNYISKLMNFPQQLTAENSYVLGAITLTSPTPTPSNTPPTNSPNENSIITPTFIEEIISHTSTPTPIPVSTSASENEFILNQINNFRNSNGLNNLQTDGYVCGFANLRASEVVSNFNHNGFSDRFNSKSLPYPSTTKAVENIAMNGDYTDVFSNWKNSPGHSRNMLSEIYYGCVGKSGNFYAFEGYSP